MEWSRYFDAKIFLNGESQNLLIELLAKTVKSYNFTIISTKRKPSTTQVIIRYLSPEDSTPEKTIRDFITSLNLEFDPLSEDDPAPIAYWADIAPAPPQS